jgi:hypothetical protein
MALLSLVLGCFILGNEYGASAGFAVFFIALATT